MTPQGGVGGCRGPRYLEIDSDVGSSSTAHHVTGMVQGALKSVIVDIGVLLEGRATVGPSPFAVCLHKIAFSACTAAHSPPCLVQEILVKTASPTMGTTTAGLKLQKLLCLLSCCCYSAIKSRWCLAWALMIV